MTEFCDEIQKIGKGIGSASRYKILESLMSGPKTVNEIVEAVKMTQPAISQHLRTLKACDVVSCQKQGKEVHYSINVSYTLGILRKFLSNIDAKQKPAKTKTKLGT